MSAGVAGSPPAACGSAAAKSTAKSGHARVSVGTWRISTINNMLILKHLFADLNPTLSARTNNGQGPNEPAPSGPAPRSPCQQVSPEEDLPEPTSRIRGGPALSFGRLSFSELSFRCRCDGRHESRRRDQRLNNKLHTDEVSAGYVSPGIKHLGTRFYASRVAHLRHVRSATSRGCNLVRDLRDVSGRFVRRAECAHSTMPSLRPLCACYGGQVLQVH